MTCKNTFTQQQTENKHFFKDSSRQSRKAKYSSQHAPGHLNTKKIQDYLINREKKQYGLYLNKNRKI